MPKGGRKPGTRYGGRQPMPDDVRPVIYALRVLPSVAQWLKASDNNKQLARDTLTALAHSNPIDNP